MRRLSVVIVVALAGCGGPAKPAPTPPAPAAPAADAAAPAPEPEPTSTTPSDAELDALFAKTLDFFDQLALAVSSNEASCPAMARELDRVFTANKALTDEAARHKGNAAVDAKADAYMDAHKDRVASSTGKMFKGLEACDGDPDVQAVLKRFDDL